MDETKRQWHDINEVLPILEDPKERRFFLLQCRGNIPTDGVLHKTAYFNPRNNKFYEWLRHDNGYPNEPIEDNSDYIECLDVLYWSNLTPTKNGIPVT